MTLSVSTQVSPISDRLIKQTSATATADTDVLNAPGTVFHVEIDNTGNAAQDVFLKLYDNAAPTVGTTSPDVVLKCRQGTKRIWTCTDGELFATAISFACVTAGGTAGTTSPGSAVPVKILAQV